MRPPTNADAVGVLGARRIPFDRIPIVDIGPMFGTDRQAMVATARRVREVCQNIGFFYIKSHGVPDELIDRAVRPNPELAADERPRPGSDRRPG